MNTPQRALRMSFRHHGDYSRDQLFGRTEHNKVVIFDKGNHHVGEFVNIRINDATSATLFGEESVKNI